MIHKCATNEWSEQTSDVEADQRAGGRRHYNSVRQLRATIRRSEVVRLLEKFGWKRGVQSRIAGIVGVHRSTVSRDIWGLMRQLNGLPPPP